MTTTLDDLIARLETATGPDGELDRDIDFYINRSQYSFRPTTPPCWEDDLPRYTASIDAALTLVPEGVAGWDLLHRERGGEPFGAVLWKFGDDDMDVMSGSDGLTPALALCIAALKARKTEGAA